MRKHKNCPDQLRLPFDSSGFSGLAEVSPVSNVVCLNWKRQALVDLTGVESVVPTPTGGSHLSGGVEEEIIQRVLLRAKRLPW